MDVAKKCQHLFGADFNDFDDEETSNVKYQDNELNNEDNRFRFNPRSCVSYDQSDRSRTPTSRTNGRGPTEKRDANFTPLKARVQEVKML